MINGNIEFENLWVLALLLIIPLFILLRFRKKRKPQAVAVPNLSAFKTQNSLLRFFHPFLFWIRLAVLALLILALARPRIADVSETVQNEKGIDIMLTVDTSLSMLTKDLQPDRLTALKGVAEEFVRERPTDRIGLISYSGEALTLVPLTMDKNILIQQIGDLQTQVLEGGTAIGVGLATAVNHLKDSKAKSKIIILMTDGVNNAGFVDPLIAADIAREKDIKIYTIGIGTNGIAPFPARINMMTQELEFEPQKVEIDEDLLKAIAEKTDGEYFRATNNQSLLDIYRNINRLEKSDINALKYYNYIEEYRRFLFPALLLLLLELFLRGLVKTIN